MPSGSVRVEDTRRHQMRYVRAHDHVSPSPTIGALDLSPLLGLWQKTNEGAQAVRSLEIAPSGDGLLVRTVGDATPWPAMWGAVRAESLYSAAIDEPTAAAFIARYDLGTVDVEMQANLNLGLLVVACFHRFKDGSARADRFTREFFYHAA